MTRFTAFRSQLTSIMEALSRAAVAEICELLDDSYAVFQLEMRRSHAENQALRRKLELMQDMVARGHRDGGRATEMDCSSSSGGGPPQPKTNCRRKGRVSVPTAPPAGGDASSAGGAGEGADRDLMKYIKTEDEGVSDKLLSSEDGPELDFLDGGDTKGRASASGRMMTSAIAATPWEQSDHQSSAAPGSPPHARHFPSNVLFNPNPESGRGSPAGPPVGSLFVGSPGGSPSQEQQGSRRLDPDVELSSAWTERALPSTPVVPLSALSAPGHVGSRSGPPDQNHHCRGRRFVCSCCRKSFTSSRSLETHMRVHTGERPYGCAQCGKRFTQSGHLKTHQSVHTGERPFACQHCGKRFAGKQNLRIHQQKHHPAERGGA